MFCCFISQAEIIGTVICKKTALFDDIICWHLRASYVVNNAIIGIFVQRHEYLNVIIPFLLNEISLQLGLPTTVYVIIKSVDVWLLCILTRKRVLCITFASWNLLFHIFQVFCLILKQKRGEKEEKYEKMNSPKCWWTAKRCSGTEKTKIFTWQLVIISHKKLWNTIFIILLGC